MSPEEIQELFQGVAERIPQRANTAVAQIAEQTAELAPGVAETGGTGGQGIGAYNYNRLIQPTVATLRDDLILQGRQGAFREGVREELTAAERAYELAQRNMRTRQREAAERARQRAEEARQAAMRAYSSGGGGGGGGGGAGGGGGGAVPTVGGVNVVNAGAAPSGGGANMNQRGDGGFNFTNAQGQPISANSYAQIMGIPFVQLVNRMANAGDAGARSVMAGPGVDRNRNPAVWRALTWG